MSDLAASGGYYIAAAGDVIVAQPGHADRIDRRLHRQVRHRRHARQARREHRGVSQRQARRDLLARSAGSRPKSGPRSRSRCRPSTTSSSSASPRRGTRRRRRSIRLRRAGCGPASRRGRSGSSTSWAGCTWRSTSAKQRARIPAEEEVAARGLSAAPQLLRSAQRAVRIAVGAVRTRTTAEALMALLGPRDRQLVAALLAPSRLFRSGECSRTCPTCSFARRDCLPKPQRGPTTPSGKRKRPAWTQPRRRSVCARVCGLTAAGAAPASPVSWRRPPGPACPA